MPNNFDTAFLNKIKSVWKNTIYSNIAVTYQNVMDSADSPNTKLELPLINIYRPEGYSLNENQTITARLQGVPLKDIENNDTEYTARFITATLDYQLDFFGTSTEMLDDITKDISHMLSLTPTLTVTQLDRTRKFSYTETYQIKYSQGPRDVSEFDDGQRIYRYAMVYAIDTARLVNFRQVYKLDGVEINVDLIKDDGEKWPVFTTEQTSEEDD